MKKLRLVTSIAAALAANAALAQDSIELSTLDGSDGFVITGVDASDQTGFSVSAAGDINGDGIDDVVISAPYGDIVPPLPDPTINDVGDIYVVFGSTSAFSAGLALSGLDGSNGFVLTGIDAGDRSGLSVSGAGDVNGDGIDDLIIGASYGDPSGNNRGESYVVFGSTSAFPASFDLGTLDGTNGFALNGVANYDRSGFSVSSAGDVDGDGVDDVIISAYRADPGGESSAGESYVVFGDNTGFSAAVNLSGLDGSDGFVIEGIDANDQSGRVVSNAGDVNGDGNDDVIIGAPLADQTVSGTEGESYVVFGDDSGFPATVDLANLDGSDGFALIGIDPDDQAGRSVSAAGDINSDGFDDVLIGAENADPGTNAEGEIYVVFGGMTFSASIDLSSLDGTNGFVLNGIDVEDYAGVSVSHAGDVNGDGVDDVIIGAPYADPGGDGDAGESYVVFGNPTGFPASVNLSALSGSDGLVINGVDAGDESGGSVSGAGDVNGDGIDDLIIGASSAGVSDVGESYVVFGNAAPMAVGSTTLLASSLEDDSDPGGTALDPTVAGSYMDTDPFAGLAVTADVSTAGQGTWQYSTDGVNWVPVPAPLSDAAALVLTSSSFLRFVPQPDFFGQPGALSVRLWDGRFSSAGEDVDITNAIGAFGGFANNANLLDITLGITPVNDAPDFTASNPPAVNEDPGSASVNSWSVFDPGPGEAGQAATYEVQNISNAGLFSTPPAIDTSGNLTYEPAQDANGSSTFDVRVMDDGGTTNGGVDLSGFQNFTITVNPVNDAPSLAATNPPAANEDAGAQAVNAWSAFDPGPGEADLVDSYEVQNVSNPGLFDALPAVDASGNLSYTSAQDASGSSTFDVRVIDDGGTASGGDDTSDFSTFTITVNPVNDVPSFTAIDPPAVNEDPGGATVPVWSAFDPGPGEAGQEPTYEVQNLSNAGLFSTPPAVDASGNLTYEPAQNANGSSTFDVRVRDDGGTANGGVDVSDFQTFTITVNPVNDAPGLFASDPPAVNEDAGNASIIGWSAFNPGFGESGQSVVSYEVDNVSNPGLFSTLPAVDVSGNLTYGIRANLSGSSTFDVRVTDDGGTANGGEDTSDFATFSIVVNAVNDQPGFTAMDPPAVDEDSGTANVPGWTTAFDPGPGEAGQSVLAYQVSNVSNPNLFSALPTVDAAGNLEYTLEPNANGNSTFDVRVTDDGGTAFGGLDTSDFQRFAVIVNSVNDAPSFTASNPPRLTTDGGPQTVEQWATVSAGPPDEAAQQVTLMVTDVGDPALFDITPSVDASGTLTYTPAAGAQGTSTFTVQAMDDGGTARGGVDTSAPQQFVIDLATEVIFGDGFEE